MALATHKTVAVDHVDLDLYEGEVVSIVGESGSGKTTLAKMLLGLINETEGESTSRARSAISAPIARKRNTGRTSRLSFRIRSLPYNMFNKIDAVLVGLHQAARRRQPAATKRKSTLMTEACSFVNLKFEELTNKYPFELSGGQQQRLMIARIFLLKPKILLADEPTSMIDACSRATILDVLMQLRNEIGMTRYLHHP